MKAKFFISLVLISLTIQINAQTIPNHGFENWNWNYIWFENPTNWITNNNQVLTQVVKDTIPFQGNYAIKVSSYGFCKSIFEFPNHPISLNMYIKTEFIEIDTVSIDVFIYSDGNIVDSGSWLNTNISPVTNWTMTTIPITQNTALLDSIEIQINGGSQWGTSLGVDEFSFEIISGIEEIGNRVLWSLNPNPITDKAVLTFEDSNNENKTLTIYNSTGHLFMTIDNITTRQVIIEKKNLVSGLYIFQLQNKRGIISLGKFIVN